MREWSNAVQSSSFSFVEDASRLTDRKSTHIEGSCQETRLSLPQLLTTFFRCALLEQSPPPTCGRRRIRVFVRVVSAVRRRTIHPSGSRPRDGWPPGQPSAPGTWGAPENRRYPAASNRMMLTNAMAPFGVRFPYGSRQRRRQTQPFV